MVALPRWRRVATARDDGMGMGEAGDDKDDDDDDDDGAGIAIEEEEDRIVPYTDDASARMARMSVLSRVGG